MITGIILGSGFSSRMGKNKLLLPLEGKTVIEHVICNSISSKIEKIILVTQYEEIVNLYKHMPIDIIINNNPELGMGHSIKLGIEKSPLDSNGYLILLGDMPNINSLHINRLIESFKANKNSIIVPIYNEIQGNPVLFPKSLKKELLSINGDFGGKHILRSNSDLIKKIDFFDSAVIRDIDTKEDYSKYL